MLLSIIIPIYNLEKYISKCLDSIIEQFDDEVINQVEIILVNDGSTDSSEQICKRYGMKYPNIQYIYQKNLGVSVARNHGLKISKGEYIFFVDGDDFLLNNSIKNILLAIEYKKPDMIFCDFINVYTDKLKYMQFLKKAKRRKNILKRIKDEKLDVSNLYKILNNGLFNPSMWCNLVKKDILIENNIKFNEKVKYTEDMEVAFKILICSKTFDIIATPIYGYRISNYNSVTHKITEKRLKDNFNFYIKLSYKLNYMKIDKKVKQYIIKFANYEYAIVVATLFLAPSKIYRKMYNRIQKHSRNLKNIKGLKGIFIKYIYTIFGFDITGRLLSIYLKTKI